MTRELERLAGLAAELAPPEALSHNDLGFTLATSAADLDFFASGGAASTIYCRARVGALGEAECPAAFAEAALMGNFFWRATEGATLSWNETENAIYLTDRFDEGAMADAKALANYADGFLRTLHDWRARLQSYLEGKEVSK